MSFGFGIAVGLAVLIGGYFLWHHFHVKHRLAAVEKAIAGTPNGVPPAPSPPNPPLAA